MTSEELARCLSTHPVVVRRTLGELRKSGLVRSEKGHGGGWSLTKAPHKIALLDVYVAIGEQLLPEVKKPDDDEQCVVIKCMASTMGEFVDEARSLLESRLRRISLKTFLDEIDRVVVPEV